ncbi:endonuclease-3 [Desulfohalotomaculum tongense]|uniref:endonuclease III n=1 Tax=Desulforadius tongensis TaxID=1216062 RepID=UPI001959C579|nr:endonuclease III [Desulforadius tongensis]MBM7855256.1 endonuclease-3 [Desulforadius tongensis]
MSKENSRVLEIIERLKRAYPHARCGLNHRSPFELLIATILSAQCTDKRVNIITEKLFSKYRTPADFARLTPEQLAEEIKGCGLHHNKSRAIVETCRILMNNHRGEVPQQRKALEALPGVGRKTAGVVLGVGFGQAALPVDTHVHRVAHRLGLASGKNPETTERELMSCIPKDLWQPAHHLFIAHGRETCSARRPKCNHCPVMALCPQGPGGER